jgi:hypothetical protein
LRNVIDRRYAETTWVRLIDGIKFHVPNISKFAAPIEQVDQAAADATDSRYLEFAAQYRLSEWRGQERPCTIGGGMRIINAKPERANRRTVRYIKRVGETFAFAINDKIDVALTPYGHVLRFVFAPFAEAEASEDRFEIVRRCVICRELNELNAFATGPWRQGFGSVVADSVSEKDQRSHAVCGDRSRRPGAELIVEYFQRPETVKAGRLNRAGEIKNGEIALAGHVTEVPAPRDKVEFQFRRVCELDQEQLFFWNPADAVDVNAARKGMEAVKNKAD